MKFKKLQNRTIKWANEKGILESGTPLGQAMKTAEEALELIEAVEAQSKGLSVVSVSNGDIVDTKAEIEDALGDILVTIAIQAHMQGMDLEKAWEKALNVIEKRKGQMVNGQFVKE